MTTKEAIDLFYSEMVNEIFHSAANEELKESLLRSLKEVKETVITTVKSSK